MVYIVDQPYAIDRFEQQVTTAVFMNPDATQDSISFVDGIDQPNNTNLSMYGTYPWANWTSMDYTYRFFINPVKVQDTLKYHLQFFNSIEPLQVRSRIWYLYSKGGVKFEIKNSKYDHNPKTTKAFTTTGLVMCGAQCQAETILFQMNPNNNRTVGFQLYGELTSGLNITFISGIAMSSASFIKGTQVVGMSTELSADYMYVGPNGNEQGKYYVQYYGIANSKVLHFPLSHAFNQVFDVEVRSCHPSRSKSQVQIKSKLFFSSSSPNDQISQIQLIAGNEVIQMRDFYNFVNDDNSKVALIMETEQIYFNTTLDKHQIKDLQGYVYVCTKEQGENSNFKVFDVNDSFFLKTNVTSETNTMVFINFPPNTSDISYQPRLSAKLSGLKLADGGSFRLYRGVPPASMSENDYEDVMFQMPIVLDGNVYYINNIEQMQINFEIWYITNHIGFEMKLDRAWDDPERLNITGTSVTGLITCEKVPENVRVSIPLPDDPDGTHSGFFVSANPIH
ncbi:unnamed protein product [Caenorhabditis bovis]|uniref:Uncharacterized protein n=1 Tax=Caenorhabditis bovis TaxID=2654633 RepID=A0A8S1F850_9PELO|nr:unnamed protein product [Caenorhabditis bovis]